MTDAYEVEDLDKDPVVRVCYTVFSMLTEKQCPSHRKFPVTPHTEGLLHSEPMQSFDWLPALVSLGIFIVLHLFSDRRHRH